MEMHFRRAGLGSNEGRPQRARGQWLALLAFVAVVSSVAFFSRPSLLAWLRHRLLLALHASPNVAASLRAAIREGKVYRRPSVPLIADITAFGRGHCVEQLLAAGDGIGGGGGQQCALPFPDWADIVCSPSAGCDPETGTFPCSSLRTSQCASLAARPSGSPSSPASFGDTTTLLTCPAAVKCRVSRSLHDATRADGVILSHVGFFPGHLRPPLSSSSSSLFPPELTEKALSAYLHPSARYARRQVWALDAMWEPSASYYPAGRSPAVLQHFQLAYGADRAALSLSSFRLSYLPDWDAMLRPYSPENRAKALEAARAKFGPTFSPKADVVFVASNCDTPWKREAYVRELMRHIPVDSWGRCLNNRGNLGEPFARNEDASNFASTLEDKHLLIAPYRFAIAFENTVQTDYVTEKLFDVWESGGPVPLYIGAPNAAKDYVPGPDSFVDASFLSPSELAALVRSLLANETAYERFHAWRTLLRGEWVRGESPLAKTVRRHEETGDPLCAVCAAVHEDSSEGLGSSVGAGGGGGGEDGGPGAEEMKDEEKEKEQGAAPMPWVVEREWTQPPEGMWREEE